MKTILITGGTGLVGVRLSKLLSSAGYVVTHLSRNPTEGTYKTFHWDIKKGAIDQEAISSADAIIHLAGAGVADKRWNEDRKKEIYDSRIDSTKLLKKEIAKHNPKLEYFLSASAIGYYGWDTGGQLVDESSPRGDGFLADVVNDWEAEVSTFDELGIKNGKLRIGVVLSAEGGALLEIAKPIKLFAGAALGPGDQFMSWIHIDDLCRMFQFMLENSLEGVFNGVAPHPETNSGLTKKLAAKLGRPLWLPNVPKFALQLLVGEMAGMLIGGNRVSSQLVEKKGFKFKHQTLEEALDDLL